MTAWAAMCPVLDDERLPEMVKALHHTVGAALLLEQFEQRSDGTLHFLVGVENDVVAITNPTGKGKRKALFCALLSFPPWRRARIMAQVNDAANRVAGLLDQQGDHAHAKERFESASTRADELIKDYQR